jgi:hypothetical protein
MNFYVNLRLIPAFSGGVDLFDELTRLEARADSFRFHEDQSVITIKLTVDQARIINLFKSQNTVELSISSVNVESDDIVRYIGNQGGIALNDEVINFEWIMKKIEAGAIK